jgi:type IV secretion system protein VirD4
MMNKRNTLVGPQLQRGFRTAFQPDWKRASGFLAAILLGAIVATQVLANSFHYHPSLGLNLFHVYPPWNYFVWSHLWERTNHAVFAQAFGIGSMVTIGCFFLLLLDVARPNFRVNPYLHGSARWADRRDIKAAGLLCNDGVYVGAWTDKAGKPTICGTQVLNTSSVMLQPEAGRGSVSLFQLSFPGARAYS